MEAPLLVMQIAAHQVGGTCSELALWESLRSRTTMPSSGVRQRELYLPEALPKAFAHTQVNGFDLNVDSPEAAGSASPDLAPQRSSKAAAREKEDHMLCHTAEGSSETMNASKECPSAASACTAQRLQAIPTLAAGSGEAEAQGHTGHADGLPEKALLDDRKRGECAESSFSPGQISVSHVMCLPLFLLPLT